MKKYILSILILLIAFVSNAQTFQNYNQYGGRWKRSITDTLQGLPADTIRPRASEDDVPFIAVKNDTVYVWSIDQLRWLPLSVAGGGTLGSARTELISGGIVIPLGGYDFFVTAALYRIDNVLYTSDTVTLTLPAADNDSSRIDRFYLNIDGEATFKTGDLAPPASVLEPQLDGDQLGLAFVAVNAGASEPAIITLIIYDENVGESVVTNQGTTTDPDNTTNVQNGTKSLNVTNINDPTGGGFDAIFIDRTSPLTWQVLGFDGVTGWIKLKQVLATNADFRIQLFRGTQAVSSEVIISLNKNDITNYQPFTIPGQAFGNVTNTEITRVRIRYTRPGNTATHTGFYLDNFYFIDGVVQPPPAIVSMTLNVPASMTVSPSNTIQSGGTWNLTFNGQADEYISGNGVATAFPDIPNKVGLVQGRAPNANRGMTIDADSIFLDSASLTNYGVMSPYAYDKLFNYVVQQYYISNVGDGDTLVIPINDTVTAIKSLKEGTGVTFTVTDSTITINSAAGTPQGLQDVITTDNQLTGANSIDINTGSLEIESTAYPTGLIKAGNNGIVTIGDEGASLNSTYIEVDDALETIFIRGDAGVTVASPIRLNQLAGVGVRIVTADAEGDLSTSTVISTPTLQEVFNQEVGGSVLTKSDTIDLNANTLMLFDGDVRIKTGSVDILNATTQSTYIASLNGSQSSFVASDPSFLTGFFSENSSFGGGVTVIKDTDSDSMELIVEAQYININYNLITSPDTTSFKPLVLSSSGRLYKSYWSPHFGDAGGGGLDAEGAQDAVGAMINASLQYVDGTPLLSIADRDWGPFTSSSNGTVFDIDNLAIVNADINDVAWSKVTGAPAFVTSNIYSANGTLAGNRALALGGFTLNMNQGANYFLKLDPTAGAENAELQAYNTTGAGNLARFQATASNTNAEYLIQGVFNATSEFSLNGSAVSGGSSLSYDAGTHQFTGNVGIGVSPTVLFQVQSGGNDFLRIDPTAGAEVSQLRAVNTTDDDNFAVLKTETSNTDGVFTLLADFNNSVKTTSIIGLANTSEATLAYTADTHTFTGNILTATNNTYDIGNSTNSFKDIYSRTLKLDGSTSGTATITAPAVAGTPTLTLPTTTGTLALTTDISITKGFMTDLMTANGISTIIPRYIWTDEFQGAASNAMGGVFTLELVSGTGANASSVANASSITGASGFGYAEINTGTTTTGKAVLQGGHGATNNNQMGAVNNDIYYRVSFKNVIFNDLSDGTETYKTWMGFGVDNANTNGIWFTYTHSENSGVFNCHSYNNTTVETTSTATTVAADTEYDLDIEYYNQTAKFYINGTLVATHTTQVPAAASVMQAPLFKILKSAGTTARVVYLDAMTLRITHENDL